MDQADILVEKLHPPSAALRTGSGPGGHFRCEIQEETIEIAAIRADEPAHILLELFTKGRALGVEREAFPFVIEDAHVGRGLIVLPHPQPGHHMASRPVVPIHISTEIGKFGRIRKKAVAAELPFVA